MVQHGSSEGNYAWLQGCRSHTNPIMWHAFSHSRTISSRSLLPIVSMMQPAHPRE
jgi:hypothetical protein